MSGLIGGGSGGVLRVQEFRSSGTFTVPAGVKAVGLFMVGAGGGSTGAGKAGQGGNVVEINYSVVGKATCAVLIGAGVSGGDGGNTSFDGVAFACGGIANGANNNTGNTAASVPSAGRRGFGGHGQYASATATQASNPVNGAQASAAGAANTGAGGASGSGNVAGGSGYLRAEWYE